MANFSHEQAHRFWSSYEDGAIYKAIMLMDATESWTHDGNEELEHIMRSIGEALKTASEVQSQKQLVKLYAAIKISRVLFMLQFLDNSNPGSASRLLEYTDQHKKKDKWCDLFTRRNLIFERTRILQRLCSSDRLQFIQSALEGETGN